MNNCWISSCLTYNIFHFLYIKIYIFILLTDFKYGYGITKSNDSVHKQPGEQGKEVSHHESIDSLAIKPIPTIFGVNSSSIIVGNDTASSFMPSKLNTTITGFYVFVGLSAVIICYFVIKALRYFTTDYFNINLYLILAINCRFSSLNLT